MDRRTDLTTTHGTTSAATRGLARLVGGKAASQVPISAEMYARLQASHLQSRIY